MKFLILIILSFAPLMGETTEFVYAGYTTSPMRNEIQYSAHVICDPGDFKMNNGQHNFYWLTVSVERKHMFLWLSNNFHSMHDNETLVRFDMKKAFTANVQRRETENDSVKKYRSIFEGYGRLIRKAVNYDRIRIQVPGTWDRYIDCSLKGLRPAVNSLVRMAGYKKWRIK